MDPFFQNIQYFGCLPSKISKNFECSPCDLKNRPIFQEKSSEMGTFLAKMTFRKLEKGKGFEAWASHPLL